MYRNWQNITTAATTLVRADKCRLVRVCVNRTGAALSTLILRDNSAMARVIATIQLSEVDGPTDIEFDAVIDEGLVAVTAGTQIDLTIITSQRF